MKVKGVHGKVAGMKVTLKLELKMPKGWIDRTVDCEVFEKIEL